jgi:hypothetical protein
MSLPPPHSPAWREMHAEALCRVGFRTALSYLRDAGDPTPERTAAACIWRVAIDTTAEAVKPANDTAPFAPLLGEAGD